MTLACAALVALPALALDPAKSVLEYSGDLWQDELPQNTVHAIVQDRTGYIWAGTYEGLVRFDGTRFEVFDRRNTPEIASNSIWALLPDSSGVLWAGTHGGGLVRYAGGAFTRIDAEQGLASNFVYSLCEGPPDTVWAGTDRGVSMVTPEGARVVFTAEDLSNRTVRGMLYDRAGVLWLATDGAGLFKVVNGLLERVEFGDPALTSRAQAVRQSADGAIWVATYGGGLWRLGEGVPAQMTVDDGLPSDLVASLLEDRDGNLWIGTDGGGLARLRSGRVDVLSAGRGLSHDYVRSLCEDREGSLWVGTNGGLNRIRDGKFINYGADEGLTDNNVRTICQHPDGSVWIGTDGGGVNRIHDGRVTSYTTRNGLATDVVKSIYCDRAGTVWVGTNGGLNRIRDGKVSLVSRGDGLSNDNIMALYEDRSGALWVGTYGGGANRIKDGRITSITTRDGLAHDIVRAIHEDRSGAIWFGTTGGGLSVLRDGELSTLKIADGLSSDVIFTIYEDAEGTLWFGTGGGLTRYRGGKLSAYSIRQGLFDDNVFQILEDGAGTLWMSCNRGIFSVRKRDLDALDAGHIATVPCQSYGRADGMGATQCNGASQPAGWKTADGKLWFPTVRGASVIDPAAIHVNLLPPPVTVERVVANGAAAPLSLVGDFSPGSDNFEFHYTALSFVVPERVRFKYRLEGYDRDWVDAGTRRAAYYTNLPPGDYTFRVIAANDDGVWNDAGASYSFRLGTPVWMRWWAFALYALGAAGLVYGGYRLRVRHLRRRNIELERKVAERTAALDRTNEELASNLDRLRESEQRALAASRAKSAFLAAMSHELRTPLNAIMGFVQLMARERDRDPAEAENLAIIARSGEHLLRLINDVLSLSKIEAGRLTLDVAALDLPRTLREVTNLFRVRADAKRLDLVLDLGPELPPFVYGDEGKLRQVLINLVGNAVKFTDVGQVALRARWSDGIAVFEVADTGIGISAEEHAMLFEPFAQTESGRRSSEGTGLGLAISRRFVALMGGSIEAASAPGRGSTFRVTVPLSRAEGVEPEGEPMRVLGLEENEPTYRVLAVDDQWENRALLLKLLSPLGFEVREAANGKEALEIWEAWAPQIVLMDMRLPVMDGFTATRKIRVAERARAAQGGRANGRTAILALSASVFEHDREAVLAAGCDDFVAKPFREAVLFEKLREHAGVRFVYDGGGPPEPSAGEPRFDDADLARRLGSIDGERRAALARAMIEGDVAAASVELARVAEHDPLLAEGLGLLVRAYRFEDVVELVERAEDDPRSEAARSKEASGEG